MNQFIALVCLLITPYLALNSAAETHAQDPDSVTTESAVESAPAASGPSIPAKVSEVLTRMADFLNYTPKFTGTAVFANDVLQPNGQVLEFGGTVDLTIHAPLRAKIAMQDRTGPNITVTLDGQTLFASTYINDQFVYDSTRQPGDITVSLKSIAEDFGISRPLQGIFSANVLAMFAEASSGNYIGKETIGGLLCDHLLLRTDTQDVQIWITQGDQPAPVRILIVHKGSQGQLREWMQFSDWNFSPDLPADSFALPIPENAERFHFFRDAPDSSTE
jgi:hypothetical protein